MENVLGSFSLFYIEITYSNFTFCGAYTLSFLAHDTILGKRVHPMIAYWETFRISDKFTLIVMVFTKAE